MKSVIETLIMVWGQFRRFGWIRKSLGVTAVGLVLDCPLSAQTFTWDGEAGDGSWNTAPNWDPDGIPNGFGSAAVIESPAPTVMGFSRALNRVVINEGGQQIELGGTMPGDEYDRLQVTGDLALGGELRVTGSQTPSRSSRLRASLARSATSLLMARWSPPMDSVGTS